MITRRAFMTLTPLALASLAISVKLAFGASDKGLGCWLQEPEFEAIKPRMRGVISSQLAEQSFTGSGDVQIDHRLGRALVRLSQRYDVNPGFTFFREEGRKNAFATARTLMRSTRGTVLFGLTLLDFAMAQNDGGMSVLTVCAHEFAHIKQFETDFAQRLTDYPTAKLVELHADYCAGYYLALRKKEYPILNIQKAGAVIESLGTRNSMSKTCHGTPEERVQAIEAGYRFGKSGNYDIDACMSSGYDFVESNFV
jgi:hypothetical protein